MFPKTKIIKLKKVLEPGEERLSVFFAALSDPGRFRIFKILLSESEACVTDIARVLGISVPAASQQLRVLERAGLVRRERHGQMICYEVKKSDPAVGAIIRVLRI